MTKEKCAVLVYHDFYEHLKDLTFEQKGKLFDAILEYDMKGSVSVELDPVSLMAFKFIKSAIDRDKEAYNKKCAKNAQNASKGGRPKREIQEENQTVLDETDCKNESEEKPNGFQKNRTDILKTQKTERFFSKPKKPDKDNDNDIEKDNDKDPLPIEGVKGEEVFSSFLNRVQGRIPEIHIENCYLSLIETIKNGEGLLKCVDDWLLTVFNQNGKTNFPAKSLVEYARANFEKYKPPKSMTIGVENTQKMLEENRQMALNSFRPQNCTKEEALEWLKNLPSCWFGRSKIARGLIEKFHFDEKEFK